MRTLKITQDEGKLTMGDKCWEIVEQDLRLKLGQRQSAPNGNDMLYYFCEQSPLHKLPPRDDVGIVGPTPEEAAFADQMWLIGRAYAASPQRYKYTVEKADGSRTSRVKPSEKWIENEGYESFFSDIARIITSNSADNQNRIPSYLQRRYVDPNEALLEIAESNGLAQDESRALTPSDANRLREVLAESQGEIATFPEFQKQLELLNADNPIEKALRSETGAQEETATAAAEKIAGLVAWFSSILCSARLFRDVAILLETARFERNEKHAKSHEPQEADEEKDERAEACRTWIHAMLDGHQDSALSFSSKFLHFHYPSLFFIYDGISSGNLRKIHADSGQSSCPLEVFGLEQCKREISSKRCTKCMKASKDYRKHVIKELKVARMICNRHAEKHPELNGRPPTRKQIASSSNGAIPHYRSITRMVDILATNNELVQDPPSE